ncbi:hypothetical protein ECZU34_58570 [Escherichia coli]|nr:hypothetical protein ECZU34_58570 [Escherichia coli]
MLVVGKGAASGKEEGKFSALLAPRQPDWVASQGVERVNCGPKLLDLGEKGVYSSYTCRVPCGDYEGYVDAHVRRLEALRRAGIVERIDADQWRIPMIWSAVPPPMTPAETVRPAFASFPRSI